MRATRKLARRSFLAAVAGAGTALMWSGAARAHPVSDTDPKDPSGAGVRGGTWPGADMDSGPAADPPGRARRLGHFSDADSGAEADPAGHGRRVHDEDRGSTSDAPSFSRVAITDSDSGPDADPPNRGRRPPRP